MTCPPSNASMASHLSYLPQSEPFNCQVHRVPSNASTGSFPSYPSQWGIQVTRVVSNGSSASTASPGHRQLNQRMMPFHVDSGLVPSAQARLKTVHSMLPMRYFAKKERGLFWVRIVTCLVVIVVIVALGRIWWCIVHACDDGLADQGVETDHGRAIECQRQWHNFVFFTDHGCFPHVRWDGFFVSSADKILYKNKFCPFARDDDLSQVRRSLLFWYRTLAIACFNGTIQSRWNWLPTNSGFKWLTEYVHKRCPMADEHEDKIHAIAKTQNYESIAPFSLSDIGHACFVGDPKKLDWRIPQLKAWLQFGISAGYDEAWLEPRQLCKTFLQLPVMFTSIGFDQRGLMWEDPLVRSVTTFYGVLVARGQLRKGDPRYCFNDTEHDLGDASVGRLVLRAMLPTYFKHVYVSTPSELIRWALWHSGYIRSSAFSPTKFLNQLSQVCRAASTSYEDLDNLFGDGNRSNMFSTSVSQRDADTCNSYFPCHYRSNVCSTSEPCFSLKRQRCSKPIPSPGPEIHCKQGQVLQCDNATDCQDPELANKCDCDKAICWYFVADFLIAMRDLPEIPECTQFLKDKIQIDER